VRRTLTWIVAVSSLSVSLTAARAADPPRFEWKDGDRVVLIGDTLVERDQKYGYLETLVTATNPEKTIVFRNLGWSADTPLGLSRAGFDPPAEGYKRLKEHVLALKPTVLIVGYGMAASFDGKESLPRFVKDLNELLDALTVTKARVILLSPVQHEKPSPPLPDPGPHTADLKLYADAIAEIARTRGYPFINLYQGVMTTQVGNNTNDGIHLTDLGYCSAAAIFMRDLDRFGRQSWLGLHSLPEWWVELDQDDTVIKVRGTKLADLRVSPRSVRFQATDTGLPFPLLPVEWRQGILDSNRTLRIQCLDPGRYSVRIDGTAVDVLQLDGQMVSSPTAEEWSRGVMFYRSPERDQVEALRAAINEKNRLYFYRWRPQNETYLFGFRRHEQGNNAREIPLFDPLVEAKEKEIARLRRPVPHVYELKREGDAAR
jgi:hypothetical protein